MTELYTKIIQNFIVRNLRKFDAYRIEGLTSFSSLPEGLMKSWWLLCKFAFHALIKNHIVFSSKDLDSFFPHEEKRICEKIQYFGLIRRTETALETERGESFNFVHLTFQEYLAALRLAQQPLNDQLQLLKTSFTEDLDAQQLLLANANLSIVWRFYFGICFNLQECNERSISLIIKHLSTMWDFRKSDDALPFWHYAFEAKNETVTNAIIRRVLCSSGEHLEDEITDNAVIVKELDISGVETAHDSSVAIYIISKIMVCNGMDIDFDNCGLQDNQLKTLTNVLAEKQTKLQVKSLSLRHNRLTDKSVSDIFKRAIAAFQLLKTLDLENNMIGTDSIKSLALALTKLPSNVLSDLDLSHNPLGVSGMVALENAISCGSFVKLETLNLEQCFTEDTEFNMTILTSLLDAISISCPEFSRLDLSHNDFGVSEARQLSKFAPNRDYTLSQCYDLDLDVDLSHNMLTDTNLSDLFQKASPALLLLKELSLSNNRIEADGISSIATFLAISPSNKLSDLDLSYNPIGQQGLSSLESAIRSDSLRKLNYLSLKGSLTDDADVNNVVFSNFIDAIAVHCPDFENLDLRKNNFGMPETSVDAFLEVSSEKDREKSSIKSLDLSGSHLTENNVQDLFQQASTALQSLQELDLSSNRLGADSITSIAAAIAKSPFKCLSKLNLSHSSLGTPGLRSLEEAVSIDLLIHLQELNLRESLADSDGKAIHTFLNAISHHCPVLTVFDVSHNKLGTHEATFAVQGTSESLQDNVLRLEELLLSSNMMAYGVLDVFLRATALSSLTRLKLKENRIGAESITVINAALARFPINMLSSMNLSRNPLGLAGLQALQDTMQCGSLVNLEKLNLKETLNNDRNVTIAAVSSFMETLSMKCPNLEELNLSQNNLGGLVDLLCYTDQATASADTCHGTLYSITYYLCKSPSTKDIAKRMASKELVKQVHERNSIKTLVLDENSFSSKGIHLLTSFICLCTKLSDLHTISCKIKCDDLKLMLTQLSELKSLYCGIARNLEWWDLNRNNEIDNSAALTLLDHVPLLFPSLISVGLYRTSVSDEMINKIDERVDKLAQVNIKLIMIFVHNNKICKIDIIPVVKEQEEERF